MSDDFAKGRKTIQDVTEMQIEDAIRARMRAGVLSPGQITIDENGTAIVLIDKGEVSAAIVGSLLAANLLASGGVTYASKDGEVTASVYVEPAPKRTRKPKA